MDKDTLDVTGGIEATLYCLFIYVCFFFLRGIDAQKLPKCTANICTDLVFDGL